MYHAPVMVREVAEWLLHRHPRCLCDATVGDGGHAEVLLEGMDPSGVLVGMDRDPDAIATSRERLARFGSRVVLIQGVFVDLPRKLARLGIARVDGVLLDLGVSSRQLNDPRRGFSFHSEGPLDMRMDQLSGETAADLVSRLSESELADVIYQYGEERYSRRIARAIVQARGKHPVRTTQELATIISRAVPASYRHGRIHCATRTFQALRIAVNRELELLAPALRDIADVLRPGGRLAVIAFHSLEDRIVKQTFRSLAQRDGARLTVLTKRPQVPSEEECRANPRARSAKLRVAERIVQEVA